MMVENPEIEVEKVVKHWIDRIEKIRTWIKEML